MNCDRILRLKTPFFYLREYNDKNIDARPGAHSKHYDNWKTF